MDITDAQRKTLDILKGKLTKIFGITVSDDHITLRFNDEENELAVVSLKVVEICAPRYFECFSCNENFHIDELYDAKVKMESCAGLSSKFNVKLCYDCWCPK